MTTTATTAQLIQAHDFSNVGDGYALLRATHLLTRAGGMDKLSSLIQGVRDQLQQLERLHRLRLTERLQQAPALTDPSDGRHLGSSLAPGVMSVLQADLASVGLSAGVQSWQYLKTTEHTSPPSSVTSFIPSDAVDDLIGLIASQQGRELTPFPGGRQFEVYTTASGSAVRTVIVLGTVAVKVIPPEELERLLQDLQSLAGRLVDGIERSSGELRAQQATALDGWVHSGEVAEFQQDRIRRCLLGISDKP